MSADISQSSLNLTSEEKRVYGQLFQQADNERIGVVTGDVAVKFFERTKLDPGILAQIWQIADSENRGLLTPAGFSVALRIIGHCQSGREPSAELAKKPGPLPRFDAAAAAPPISASPASAVPASPTSVASPIPAQMSGPIRVPPLTTEKVNEFTGLFERAGSRNGLLAGDSARSMFERARLPNETLGRIWNLADTEERGALSLTEFIVAMHLITSMKSGSLRALPQSIPSGLFDAANRRGAPTPAARGIQPQYSGSQGPQRAQSPLSRPPQFSTPPLSAQSTGGDWLVAPQDKAKFDQVFASIDKGRTGYVNGEQAVQFFSTSGLPEDTLASIWDLADINSEGQLNRDEFAVAMYLIRQQRSKTDDRGNLPTSLPSQLVPPNMRQKVVPPSQPTAPAFDNAANAPQQSQPKSAADDLFGLDALSQSQASPQQASFPPSSPPSATQARQAFDAQQAFHSQPAGFKQFVPTSTFGQGLTHQSTGSSIQSTQQQSRALQQHSASDDLLGDNEPEVNSKANTETTELANMSNQIGTLRSGMSEVQSKKSGMEAEISTTSNQKRELETRLSQFRNQYESEIREVKSLEERLNASRIETRKLQQDLGMIEGTHADLQTRHRDLSTQLEADKKENATLKERTSQMNSEITQLKTALEKLQADTRQQRGLVAINKKQLATSEAERDRINQAIKEVEDEKVRLQQEETETTRLQQETEKVRAQQEAEQARLQQELEQAKVRHAEQTRALQEAQQARARQEVETSKLRQEAETSRLQQEAETSRLQQEAETTRLQQEATSAQASRSMSPVASPAASITSQRTNPFFRKTSGTSGDRTMSPSVFATEYSQGQNTFDSFFGPSEGATQMPTGTSLASEPSRDLQESGAQLMSSPPQTPQVVVPPAPPESRQINSSALPMRFGSMRSDSIGSSVRANPPASRAGDSDRGDPTPLAGTPTESLNGETDKTAPTSSPLAAISKSPGTLDEAPTQTETRYDQSTIGGTSAFEGITRSAPGAFPGDSSRATTPMTDGSSSPTGHAEPFSNGVGRSLDATDATATSAPSQLTSSFAAQQGVGGSTTEFPPIRELDNDDDSDSDDGKGFEDDFGTSPPPASSAAITETANSATTAVPRDTLPVPMGSVTEIASSNNGSALPTPQHEMSPPTYDQAMPEGEHRDVNQFPREYGGLLPSREIASSPPVEVPQSPPQALIGSMLSPIVSGQTPIEQHSREASSTAVTAEPADEFDSAFDDLSEAKEDSTEPDAFSSSQREDHEWNPSFDSPAPSQRTIAPDTPFAGSTTTSHKPNISFDSVFGSSSLAATGGASTAAFYGTDSDSGPRAVGEQMPKSATSNHDWDDLFSGLDNSTTAMNGTKDPFELDTASGLGEIRDGPAPTSARSPEAGRAISSSAFSPFSSSRADSASSPAPVQSFSSINTTSAAGSTTTSSRPLPARSDSFSPPPGPPPSKLSQTSQAAAPSSGNLSARPTPLTRTATAGEHDDPILKSLTNMGYPREQALGALERFDYNIDMAADYLTSGRK